MAVSFRLIYVVICSVSGTDNTGHKLSENWLCGAVQYDGSVLVWSRLTVLRQVVYGIYFLRTVTAAGPASP